MLKQFNLSPKLGVKERKKKVVLKGEEKGVEMTIHRKVFNFPTHFKKGNCK